MSLSSPHSQPSRAIAKRLLQAPVTLYRLGWGPWLGWLPLLILTSKGRESGLPRHVLVEFRRHGSKFYLVSGWGADTDWYCNIEREPLVTVQYGGRVVAARATPVENPAESLRALYMFSRNSWIYATLFAQMTSAQAADLSTLAEVVDEFTVVRLEPTDEPPTLPSVELFSPARRQMTSVFVLLLVLRLLLLLRRK